MYSSLSSTILDYATVYYWAYGRQYACKKMQIMDPNPLDAVGREASPLDRTKTGGEQNVCVCVCVYGTSTANERDYQPAIKTSNADRSRKWKLMGIALKQQPLGRPTLKQASWLASYTWSTQSLPLRQRQGEISNCCFADLWNETCMRYRCIQLGMVVDAKLHFSVFGFVRAACHVHHRWTSDTALLCCTHAD